MTDPIDALLQRRVIVCVGSGGVGKTTVAAALALRAAAAGRRAIVLTIDPAKRLANALGLEQLGNVETRVDDERLRRAGIETEGELWAMMLDLKRSWDDFIGRHVSPDKREAILQNRFYQTLSSALAGSQEYIATEKLYELYSEGKYDLLVLDTPPTAHALDFLEAPRRILDFLESSSVRAMAGPAMAAGKLGLKLMSFGGSLAGRALSKLTGAETLEELVRFMLEIQDTYGVFKDRAAKVKALFGSDETAFFVVTSAQASAIDEAIYFHHLLAEERIPIAGVVANRIHRDFLGDSPLPSRQDLAEALSSAGVRDTGDPPLSERLARTSAEARAMARLDRRNLERLEAATRRSPQLRVPSFDADVYDLPGLWAVDRHLFPAR
ncbi:ArsA family ATPase [Vulgatibacter incomptus]|uniref:arsenite-transporting ATPase n=1 Tax=Vulgatibacter incomptus TaxID=1391653 RepID=A0A0K1P9H1_9BACT|nr:ArsA-related P-loop ATPase [Vulgatibacter incomptus]AKU90170.1 Arsenical pump-driving ATPase [Vulgatibacter incomptus]